MNWLLLALAFVTVQPKAAEHARAAANRRAKVEAKALAPALPLPGAASAVQIPVTGSAVDSAGRKYTFSGTVTLDITEPPPPPPPPPPPVGITFSGVTDIFGAPLTGASAGKVLLLKGSGFPMTDDVPPVSPSSLRLVLAGKTMGVSAWTHTSVEFAIPNTVTDPLITPITGVFEVWRQSSGQWAMLGKGGSFTLQPAIR